MKKRYFHIILILFILSPFINISAQTRIDSMKQVIPSLSNQKKAVILNQLGYQYINYDPDYNEDSCLKYSNLALNLSKKIKNKYQESDALRTIGIAISYQQKYESSLTYFYSATYRVYQ